MSPCNDKKIKNSCVKGNLCCVKKGNSCKKSCVKGNSCCVKREKKGKSCKKSCVKRNSPYKRKTKGVKKQKISNTLKEEIKDLTEAVLDNNQILTSIISNFKVNRKLIR